MIAPSRRRSLPTTVLAVAIVTCVAGCSSGGGSAPSTPAASSISSGPTSTGSSSSATSLSPSTEPSSAEPTAAITSTAGNPGPSISGAPTLKTMLAEITRTVRPLSTVSKPLTQPDGSQSYGGLRIGSSGDQYEIDVYVNPADTSLIQVTCTSPVGPADAVRAVCTDLPYTGADPATARAWVAGAAKKIPAGNTTARIRDNDLNGLFWLVHLDYTGKNETVTVSSRPVSA